MSGEECFLVRIINLASNRLGFQLQLVFEIAQHSRDIALLQSLINFFDCGNVTVRSNKLACDFKISKFSDLHNKVIPFFQKFPIQGVKYLDYLDWCKVAELIKNQDHLTEEGLSKIRK